MIAGGALLQRVEAAFPAATRTFAFPFLRIEVQDERFRGQSDDEQEETLAGALGLDVQTLRSTMNRLFIRFDIAAPGEASPPVLKRGESWIGLLGETVGKRVTASSELPVIHFYGFKGGQGRTTLLAFLAHDLARDGYRVLAIDLDAEAPSLDLVLGVQDAPAEASIVGLRAGLDPVALSFDTPAGGGSVSLMAFRPAGDDFDLDSAALAFEAGVFSPAHDELALRVRELLLPRYDVILLDHRTGLAPTVPAWVHALPGPVVVLDRLDGQSRRARRVVESLWSGLPNPGVLVSYVPPGDRLEDFRERLRGEAHGWLQKLADAKSAFADEGATLEADDVADHWILWPDDNAFRGRTLPRQSDVGGATRESVQRLRELLDLAEKRARSHTPRPPHPSGASDQGLLIMTDALRKLRAPGTRIRFIIGRKGTGKTRLVRELALERVGEPLVVAEDEHLGGLPSRDGELQKLWRRAADSQDFEGFWWTLLGVALETQSTRTDTLRSALVGLPPLDGALERVRQLLRRDTPPRMFMIDGLETMFGKEHARPFIQSLLGVVATLEHDPMFRSRVSMQVFMRADIATWGFQNFEQLTHGKRLDLEWSTQAIFNFVLSRLPNLEWFARVFQPVVRDIQARSDEYLECALTEEECLHLLLRIFPQKLRRLNLNMSTFLRTYFSDDPQGETNYYPRVYDKFLQEIDSAGAKGAKPVQGRVDQSTIVAAHDAASKEFLKQVRQELLYLVTLEDKHLDRFLRALQGEKTPFDLDELAAKLQKRLQLKKQDVHDTLESMREIGMFEEHPSRAGAWRVGRLFKSALGMIYNRGG